MPKISLDLSETIYISPIYNSEKPLLKYPYPIHPGIQFWWGLKVCGGTMEPQPDKNIGWDMIWYTCMECGHSAAEAFNPQLLEYRNVGVLEKGN